MNLGLRKKLNKDWDAMYDNNCYQVIVKNRRGKVVKNWKASLLQGLSVRTEGTKTIIERKILLSRTQTYIAARDESVEIRRWWWFISRQFGHSE